MVISYVYIVTNLGTKHNLQITNLSLSNLQRKVALKSSAANVRFTAPVFTVTVPVIPLTLHGLTGGI